MLNDRWPEDTVISVCTVEMDNAPHTLYILLLFARYNMHSSAWMFLLTIFSSSSFPLEREMVTHSNTLAWRMRWTEEPGGLLSMGSHRVGHDWSNLACMHALEKEMATHSSVLAWRIPGTVEPGGLLSMWLHRVGHNWSDLAAATAAFPTYLYL